MKKIGGGEYVGELDGCGEAYGVGTLTREGLYVYKGTFSGDEFNGFGKETKQNS